MVLAASCLYEVVVYLAVKRKSTFVDHRTKDKVIAMGRKARQGKATLFIAAAIVCFAPTIMSGILMAPAGYSPPVARQKEIIAAHPLQVVRQRVDIPFVAVMNYREAEAITVSCFAERMENICRLSAYDSDAFSTGLYSPRSKGILSEYSDCPSQTMA